MVHGVMDAVGAPTWRPLRHRLARGRLDECLRILSARYQFVSLGEAVAMVSGRAPIKPHSLAVTFDDGYRNQITHAMPILRKWGVPGIFFLATGHIESRRPFWFDRLDFAIQQESGQGQVVRIGDAMVSLGGDRETLRRSYKSLRDLAKAVDREDHLMLREFEEIATSLENASGRRLADILEGDDWASVLSWDEVRGALAEDVEFGSHTVDHVRLDRVSSEIIADQLTRSREAIEAHTGRPCRYLCYPNGSVNGEVAVIAGRCGYEAAVTTAVGLNRPGEALMLLKRINFPEQGSTAETLAEVSGFSQFLSGLSRLVRGLSASEQEE
jgi:peptidoglycan/xylan/chitin deacetylase (PgdA/CDA1 family)